MAKRMTAIFSLLFLISITSNSFACDTKPCKAASVASTKKYVKNTNRKTRATNKSKVKYSSNKKRLKIATINVRRSYARNKARKQLANSGRNSNFKRKQIAAVNERRAHAINRARRDFALYHHIHRLASTAKLRKARLNK